MHAPLFVLQCKIWGEIIKIWVVWLMASVEEDDVNSSSGSFVRPESVFRHWVTKDGSPDPHGDGGFEAES